MKYRQNLKYSSKPRGNFCNVISNAGLIALGKIALLFCSRFVTKDLLINMSAFV